MADFVILSQDPTAIDPETLDQTKVLLTVKSGKVVYEAEGGLRDGRLQLSPFSNDPVTAHRFMHAVYQGMQVERPWLVQSLRPFN